MQVDPVLNGEEDGELPLINMSRLLYIQHLQEEAMKLGLACQEWGFFQLVNYGISDEVIERMKCEIQGFFQLPLQEKKTYAQKPRSVEGYGQTFVLSEDQNLDWGDMYFLITHTPFSRNLESGLLIPEHLGLH
ncbi:hypothetical protein J5N97_000267 [Dioscorea zingiberensis]|uniref:Non-haem dioxygenase N-terminal domain-containing protein n=1 Tax=Dioscorea zingiberensis TaxID=325984 RepID=A0A9D5BSJ4_9LILI|nr:hypothetical protein J5N97_000267 [Dioscorea zingiberensis]